MEATLGAGKIRRSEAAFLECVEGHQSEGQQAFFRNCYLDVDVFLTSIVLIPLLAHYGSAKATEPCGEDHSGL